jgi:ankyrin repeat protein
VLTRLRAVVVDQLRTARTAVPAPEPEPAAAYGDGRPADQLLNAAGKGDGAAVSRLLAAGADPNASVAGRNSSGEVVQTTALAVAARAGQLEAARLLLDAGADPDRANAYGETPLLLAAGNGRLEVARLLLDAGADLNRAASDGHTPVMMTAGYGHPEALRLLLARGAAVDAADPNASRTAFHFACFNNQAECTEVLARAGCDVGLKDSEGKTGRELAEEEGHAAVLARLRAVVVEQLRTVQAAGAAAELEPEPAAVGGDWGPADQLVTAAAQGDGAAVSRLLAAGADPNAAVAGLTPSGEVVQTTALAVAARAGQLEAARLLLDAGADPSRAASGGTTPLIMAAGYGQLEVLRLLLARGASVDAADPDDDGCTAFHDACFYNQAECAEALVRVGCDVGLKDNAEMTGRELAEAEGHAAVVERLQAVVAEQLRVAQAAGAAAELEPEAAAVAGDERPADQQLPALLEAAGKGDGAAVSRLLAAGQDPNGSVAAGALPALVSAPVQSAAARILDGMPRSGGVTHPAPSKYHDEIIPLAFIHTKFGEPIVIMVFRRAIQKVLCLSPPPRSPTRPLYWGWAEKVERMPAAPHRLPAHRRPLGLTASEHAQGSIRRGSWCRPPHCA